MMAPAARRRATAAASWAALCPRRKRLPHRVGRPATSKPSAQGGPAGYVEAVLDGYRNAVQQPQRLAAHDGVFGEPGSGAGLVVQHGDEGVDTGILGDDLRQVELD